MRALLSAVLASIALRAQPVIQTVAGSEPPSTIAALQANLSSVASTAVDGNGRIYFLDYLANIIWRLDKGSGALTRVAGGWSFEADDIGISAMYSTPFQAPTGPTVFLLSPTGTLYTPIAVDPAGNLFFGQTHGVYRIDDQTGTVTLASSLTAGAASLAVDASGNLLIGTTGCDILRIDPTSGKVQTIAQSSGCVGRAVEGVYPAASVYPTAIAVDQAGNLVVADQGTPPNLAGRIRFVNLTTGVITTIAGGGTQTADGVPPTSASISPSSVALDRAGNIFFSDGARVRRIDSAHTSITTVAGSGGIGFSGDGGPATQATLDGVLSISLDTQGNLYLGDGGRLHQVDAATQNIASLAGSGNSTVSNGVGGPALLATLLPNTLAIDGPGNMYIGSDFFGTIDKLDSLTGIITPFVGTGNSGFSGDGGPAQDAQIESLSTAIDPIGNLYICDSGNGRVRRVDRATNIITTIAGTGSGLVSGDGGPAIQAGLGIGPFCWITFDPQSNLFIALGNTVRKVDAKTGIIKTVAGNGQQGGSDKGDGGPATSAPLEPLGLAAAPNGDLYIADGSFFIRKVSAVTQIISTVAGTGPSSAPIVDGIPASQARLAEILSIRTDNAGNIYILDFVRIRRIDAQTQIITTIAGNGTYGYSPDGTVATQSVLVPAEDPHPDLALDSSGNIYYTETSKVRRIGPALTPVTIATNPPGLTVVVDGATLTAPDEILWNPGSRHTLDVAPSEINGSSVAVFNDWSQGGPASQAVVAPTTTITYTANFNMLSCNINVSPAALNVGSGSTVGTISISAVAGCPWSIANNLIWLHTVSGIGGIGNGTVRYSIDANNGASRTGTLTVAGQLIAVTQAAVGTGLFISSVVNSASDAPLIAPMSYVTITGGGFVNGASTATWDSAITNGLLPTQRLGVSVQINGAACYISYASAGQINVLAPSNIVAGNVVVTVYTASGTTVSSVVAADYSPAFFTYSLGGATYAAALFANESVYVAQQGVLNSVTSRPAKSGDYVVLYLTGLGPTSPQAPSGQVLTAVYTVPELSQVSVTIQGNQAPVLFAGMTFAGEFQVNIQIPDGVSPGDQTVVLQISGHSTQEALLSFQ